MTSGSGIFPHELAGRGRRWLFSVVACLLLAACSNPEAVEPIPAPSTSPLVTSESPPSPTAPPPTPTSIPEYRLGLEDPLIEDDFESDIGWEEGTSAQGAVSRLNGRFVVSVQGPGSTLSSLSPAEPLTDFFVEIEVHTEICESDDEFGLMLRTGGLGDPLQDSHYRFLITCEGAVRASRFLSGAEAPILPITPSTDVLPGAPAVNRIGVSAIGDQFRFFVNDMQVFDLMDGEIPSGKIGVIVRARRATQTTISFDEFRVWDLATE